MSLVTWVCEICYSEMEVTQVGPNKNRVYCHNCGSERYIDDKNE